MEKQNTSASHFAVLIVTLLVVSYGYDWTRSGKPSAASDELPTSTANILTENSSWISLSVAIGALLGNTTFGFLANIVNRKWPVYFLLIQLTLNWLQIWFTQNLYYLCTVSFMYSAITVGIFSVLSTCLVESENNRLQSSLKSTNVLNAHISVLVGLGVGIYFDFKPILIWVVVPSILFGINFSFISETRKKTFFLAAFCHFRGFYTLVNYTVTIYDEAGSFMPSNMSVLIIGLFQLNGTLIAPVLVDRIGKKASYIISTICKVFAYTSLGLYMLLKSLEYSVGEFDWIPVISFSLVIFSQSFPSIRENSAEKIINFGDFSDIEFALSWFVVLKFIPFVNEWLGFYKTIVFIGGVCIPSLLFVMIYIPDSKSYNSFEEMMKTLK